jgi:hypothetical protein
MAIGNKAAGFGGAVTGLTLFFGHGHWRGVWPTRSGASAPRASESSFRQNCEVPLVVALIFTF